VAKKIREYWIDDYLQAFHARDLERARVLKNLRHWLFPAMQVPRKIRLRALAPEAVIRAIDYVRGANRSEDS
jgi:hypothetical protein